MLRPTLRLPGKPLARRSRGLSLVELMVGITVGLFVVAGASFVAVNQISDNRRMSLEMQVQQDLRAASDLIARDLRRAGYWVTAKSGLWYEGGPNVAANPYTTISPDANGGVGQEVTFMYSRGAEGAAVDHATEDFGFKLQDHTIKVYVGGGGWQALTDPGVLKVTRFNVSLNKQTVFLSCVKACAGGATDTTCWPSQDVSRYTVQIEGQAVHDPNVRRNLTNTVRLRNDATAGACPA